MKHPVIRLPLLAAPVDQLWHVLLDLSEQLTVSWTLVGGQMVLLHALEHGRVPPQISQDGDVIADVRSEHGAITAVVGALVGAGFDLAGISTDGLAHRYVRPAEPRPVTIDVLAPEGLGVRTDLTTTKPGRTLQVPGGTQALNRTERVDVIHEGRRALVPRPSLLAALVAKGAACALPGDSARHLRDIALLCALAPDPFDLAGALTNKDRQRLGSARKLADPHHPSWQLVPSDIREQGHEAYRILTARSTGGQDGRLPSQG